MALIFLGCIILFVGFVLAVPLKVIKSPITTAFVICGVTALILGLLSLQVIVYVLLAVSLIVTIIGSIGLSMTNSMFRISRYLWMVIIGAIISGLLLKQILHP
jgi:hypothetical protein